MVETAPVGRRERKKAATRQTIIDAAVELFLDRGFDAVSVREIADRADVSPTTVFAYFPQKEALLFYDEVAQRERLVAAVSESADDRSISAALKAHYRSEYLATWSGKDSAIRGGVMTLMEKTPSLQDYASRMWVRHEDALAEAIAARFGVELPTHEMRLYARFALQIQLLISSDTDPMLDAGFELLDRGWAQYVASAPS